MKCQSEISKIQRKSTKRKARVIEFDSEPDVQPSSEDEINPLKVTASKILGK
jgi:hypothetical protein